jgi:hypothetical protein
MVMITAKVGCELKAKVKNATGEVRIKQKKQKKKCNRGKLLSVGTQLYEHNQKHNSSIANKNATEGG